MPLSTRIVMKNDDAMLTATRTALVSHFPCKMPCGILTLLFPLLLWNVGLGQETSPEDSEYVRVTNERARYGCRIVG